MAAAGWGGWKDSSWWGGVVRAAAGGGVEANAECLQVKYIRDYADGHRPQQTCTIDHGG
ncbi:hypothetical protein DPMN_072267 [Dreissena polymorpha]|uniref:Uncharacterized protein n=1 Tax=Dreissena polymorpha TaxID=45954 RepID=A0A9D4BQB3_DREPO|nr:hypothetical protein DPMN_072267 [Dreissena polymorpha]